MPNISLNTIYGQRFSIDDSDEFADTIDRRIDWSLPELRIDEKFDVLNMEKKINRLCNDLSDVSVVPALDLDFRLDDLSFERTLAQLSEVFDRTQINRVVLCVDEDNSAIQSLSPRYSDEETQRATLKRISRTIKFLSEGRVACLVAMTVEELCPGGLDPTDGIHFAQYFVESGARAIIASGGSRDFAPLKYRRETKQKNEGIDDPKSWPQPWLSSAQWLVDKISVPILAQGPITDLQKALVDARAIGLHGIVATSVKYPSASMMMADMNSSC